MAIISESHTSRAPHTVAVERRLILAVDVPDEVSAHTLIGKVLSQVHMFKFGLELLTSRRAYDVVQRFAEIGKGIFLDLKLHDIPNTVAGAVRGLQQYQPAFVTVHARRAVVEAAAKAKGKGTHILAVTVLTSEDRSDLDAEGYPGSVQDLVLARARIAYDAGADGVVCSGQEAALVRHELGVGPIIVVPGVRPVGSGNDDQKRVVTVEQAFQNGADYIVIGRPIANAKSPVRAAEEIQRTIQRLFQHAA